MGYHAAVGWEVEYTDQFGEWFEGLAIVGKRRVAAAIHFLEEQGPGLGRPYADTISSSRHANMKELRPRGGQLRILFAFDPRRMAILLIGETRRIVGMPGMKRRFLRLMLCMTSILKHCERRGCCRDQSSPNLLAAGPP
ncbi:MAG: type II toxin-antitoxin system RelE/ParE family toxin [Thermomicrobiales bacterium]|nr:type II toxin-antitoxin system RelE/ParE family toxin [Thermomicrobiales bacterium]